MSELPPEFPNEPSIPPPFHEPDPPKRAPKLNLRDHVVKMLPTDLVKNLPRSWEPMAWAEWINMAFQKQGAAFYGKLLTFFLCAFFLADITALLVARYIPEPQAPRMSRYEIARKGPKSIEDYGPIFTRNLFNSQGIIPGQEGPPGVIDFGGAPIRSTLPFDLVGTMILKDELRSIATIEDRGANAVYPVREQDEIPSKAKILKIEARRVVFLNESSGRREYIELPPELVPTAPRITLGAPQKGPGIEQVSPTQYSISRNEVDNALRDLNQILTQARCIPNFENNLPSGFKCFQIVQGSIYDKLGMKDNDVICGINGESINDVGKAFGLLEQLKTSSHIELCIKRNGRQMTMAYDIH